MRILIALTLLAAAAGAATLPGDFLVASPRLVDGSAEAGLWYLAPSPGGHLYLADQRGLAALGSYRVLHDDPETSAYFLVYNWGGGIAGCADFGRVTPLGEGVYLLVASRGAVAALTKAGLAVQLYRLAPAKTAARRTHAEPPPTFEPAIGDAVATIKQDDCHDYITALQDFGTRYSYTQGYRDAATYVHDFLADLDYDVSYDSFFGVTFDGVAVPNGGNKAWAVTDGGTIYYTTNRGNSWELQDAPVNGLLWSVDFINESIGHAVGESGSAVATVNGGASWTRLNVPYDGYLFGVSFVDANRGWVVADFGRIFATTDGGQTWTQPTSPTGYRLYDVDMADATRGWASGRNGVILHTDDGTTWTQQTTPTTQYLYGITAVSATEAWACGRGKVLLHTTDGGVNWTQVTLAQPTWANFYDVSFPDANHGFVAGWDGCFLATTDGGANWTYTKISAEDFQCCDFGSSQFGMVGGSAALYRSLDGGASFEPLRDRFGDAWVNVVAEKKGHGHPDEVVIICGHLDDTSEVPLTDAPGAEDNGSGSAAVMAAARALAPLEFNRTLRFIVWAGEEQGLLGSFHYAEAAAASHENIVGVVNLDMVAYDEENGSRDDSANTTNEASQWLAQYLIDCAALYDVHHYFDIVLDPQAGGSDHYPFWLSGYDAIFLIEGEKGIGGLLEYPYYHTSQDTVEKLRMKLEVDCARAGAATVAHLARLYVTPFAASPAPVHKPFAVYPNPYRGDRGGVIHFQGLAAGAEVGVYDLAGRRVFSHAVTGETYDWDATGSAGAPLAAGIYLYRVTGAGLDEQGKLAVLR